MLGMNGLFGIIKDISYKSKADAWRAVIVDSVTHALTTIQYAHKEIHSGDHYYMQGWTTLGNDPGVDDILRVKLVTPDTTTWSHFRWAIGSSGILLTTLDEGAAGGMANGSGVTPINNNRNSSNTSGMVLTSGVDAASGYDLRVQNSKWGALAFKSTVGGGDAREDELILKQNTTYLRTFTSYTASNIVQFEASWYEHANKD